MLVEVLGEVGFTSPDETLRSFSFVLHLNHLYKKSIQQIIIRTWQG